MKTLSERTEEKKQERAEAERLRREEFDRIRAEYEARDIPLYQSKHPGDLTDYAGVRDRLRALVREYRGKFHEAACDHCRTPLLNPEPGMMLLSSPPQQYARCPGCGFCGYMRF